MARFRALILSVSVSALGLPVVAICAAPTFEGEVNVHFEPDGRHMTLLNDFTFIDELQSRWLAPKGTMTDGASVPQIAWSLGFGPFEGKYRNAAILHDYYCDHKVRTWQDVDHMFYEAMLTSGVDKVKAGVMYAAVYLKGPRWDFQTIHNELLAEKMAELHYAELHHLPPSDEREGVLAKLVRDGKAKVVGTAFDTSVSHARPDKVDVIAIPYTQTSISDDDVKAVAAQIEGGKVSEDQIFDLMIGVTAVHPSGNTSREGLGPTRSFTGLHEEAVNLQRK